MMRRVLLVAVVAMLGAAGYIASPFYAAWNLREAIKRGDVAAIEQKVVWKTVRETLRASLAESNALLPEVNALGEAVRPTMWQRLKTAFGSSMLDRFIETYVTPEGLPKLFKYRKSWNTTVKRESDDDALPFAQRVNKFYSRITRAEFKSLTSVEIEMIDNGAPDRRIVSVMELHGTDWKLAGLRVLSGAKAGAPTPSQAGQQALQTATP